MRILSKAKEIQDAVVDLMKPGVRRVVVVAFIGADATDYIPDPKDVTIVCWPKPGGTNPDSVRKLHDRGANIYFSDMLHMKLYWAEGRGAIIGSANLSTNALGSGGLKELVVLLPDEEVVIDDILDDLSKRKVSKKALDKLDVEHSKFGWGFAGKKSKISFRNWFEGEFRSCWKFGWWEGRKHDSPQALEMAKRKFGRTLLEDFICARKNYYQKGGWVLCVDLTEEGVEGVNWLYVDFVIPNGDDLVYPYEAVQIKKLCEYDTPPFILDQSFEKAFLEACYRGNWNEKLKKHKTMVPSEKWLRMIYDAMPSKVRGKA